MKLAGHALLFLSLSVVTYAQHRVAAVADNVPDEAVALAERLWNTLLSDCGGHTYRGLNEVRNFALTVSGSAPAGGDEWKGETMLTAPGVRESIAIEKASGQWRYELPEGMALRKTPCPQADGSPTYPVGHGVTPPVLVKKVEPDYSEEARKARFQGRVLLRFVVDSEGKVRDVSVVNSPGMGLEEQAIKAVKQWKFTPGRKDGVAVNVQVQAEVSFQLR